MSNIIATAIWKLMGIPSTTKFVLIKLADNANDQGFCWPSVRSIAEQCELGQRTVQGAIQWGEKHGIIRKIERPGKTTYYEITPADYAPPQITAKDDLTPADYCTRPPQITTAPPQITATHIDEPSKEPPLEPPLPPKMPPLLFENNPTPEAPHGKPEKPKRGTSNIPETFKPDFTGLKLCSELGIDDIDAITGEFVDYWKGCGKQKADWQATFRNHARRIAGYRAERAARSNGNRQGPTDVVGAVLRLRAKREGNKIPGL